ncbi:NAD(P)-binding protein [Arcobacter sp. YIC-310]|uniref:NAD(P)-binding protein n=1 Tax=Arcobacter sp. YIC-310 TaxID=3376632 RepID=UPI003C16DEB9
MNIAIIGAGFSGCYLYNRFKNENHDIKIFEKSRGCGGRLSTKYIDDKFVDHGTPYFETNEPDFIYFSNRLERKGILRKEKNKYFPTNGINKFCSSLINKQDLIKQTKIVSCIKNKDKWSLYDENDNCFKDFDLVIFTIPAPQVLELGLELESNIKDKLKTVKYNSIASLILYDNKPFSINKELYNSQFFKKVINNSEKYNYTDFSSYVFHANESFSTNNNNKNKEDLGIQIYNYIDYFQKTKLPKSIYHIAHLWKYATVKQGLEYSYYLNKTRDLALCGDYFKKANLEGSFLSAKALTDVLIK